MRSYSQMDRASLQTTDLVEGLDSTLVMMGHKLGSGITVERHYAPGLPPIEAMAGELNQVWTNLVDNAIDAMDGNGILTVSARPDAAGWVVVEVADTGLRDAARGAGPRLRAVLHDQGRRQGHRPRPGHLAAHRRRTSLR